MKPPCDEGVVRSLHAAVPCTAQAGRWILAATILGSSMAFIDSTVVNVALAGAPSKPARNRRRRAMGGRVLRVVPGSFDSRRRLARRFIWPPIDVSWLAWRFSPRLPSACGLASNIQQLVIARSVQGMGAAFLVPGSLSHHQRIFRRENPRPSDRHLVRIHCDHYGGRAGSGRLAD